jgi:hypothetical protein
MGAAKLTPAGSVVDIDFNANLHLSWGGSVGRGLPLGFRFGRAGLVWTCTFFIALSAKISRISMLPAKYRFQGLYAQNPETQ